MRADQARWGAPRFAYIPHARGEKSHKTSQSAQHLLSQSPRQSERESVARGDYAGRQGTASPSFCAFEGKCLSHERKETLQETKKLETLTSRDVKGRKRSQAVTFSGFTVDRERRLRRVTGGAHRNARRVRREGKSHLTIWGNEHYHALANNPSGKSGDNRAP